MSQRATNPWTRTGGTNGEECFEYATGEHRALFYNYFQIPGETGDFSMYSVSEPAMDPDRHLRRVLAVFRDGSLVSHDIGSILGLGIPMKDYLDSFEGIPTSNEHYHEEIEQIKGCAIQALLCIAGDTWKPLDDHCQSDRVYEPGDVTTVKW